MEVKHYSCEIIVAELSRVIKAARAAQLAGDVHLLVNNAGISIPQPFLETTAQAMDETLAINLRALMVVSQVVAKNMIERKTGGAIVNIFSQVSNAGENPVGKIRRSARCLQRRRVSSQRRRSDNSRRHAAN